MTIYVANGALTARTVTAIAYAASITPALPAAGDAIYNIGQLTGNITINNPTGTPTEGQTIRFRFQQDGTGGRTLAWGASYDPSLDTPFGGTPTLASEKWEMLFSYYSTDSLWRLMSMVRGF